MKVYFLFPPVAKRRLEDADADGTLGTMSTPLGEMTTKTHQSEEEASTTTRICRKASGTTKPKTTL